MDAKWSKFHEQNNFQSDFLSYVPDDDSRYHESLYTPIMAFPDFGLESNASGQPLESTLSSSIFDVTPRQDGISDDLSSGFSWSSEDNSSSPSGESDSSSDPTLKYITEMLLEEEIIDQPCMYEDFVALKATENSFYDAIGQHPLSAISSPANFMYANAGSDQPEVKSWSNSHYSSNAETSLSVALGNDYDQYLIHTSAVEMAAASAFTTSPFDGYRTNEGAGADFLAASSNGMNDKISNSNASEMVRNMFSNNESVLLFKKGEEEAFKFLPRSSHFAERERFKLEPVGEETLTSIVVNNESLQNEPMENGTRSRKIHERDELDLEVRNTKQSAVAVDEEDDDDDTELVELFDKVLLIPNPECCDKRRTDDLAGLHAISDRSKGGKTRTKRQNNKQQPIDLRALLILCAQAMSASDFRTSSELLKQVRQHSSVHGDGSQRLAHYLANGLEARLAGRTVGVQNYFDLLSMKEVKAVDMLKAVHTFMCSAPFKKLSMLYLNKMIFQASEKAKTLHIVDFGILYGYQWPSLIQILSSRPGGPPKLRITGIELPQQGFRPLQRIEETGRRLARYCQRFNVPFEYHPIAEKKWENINVEDLRIAEDEFLVVNCLGRLQNLLDETGEGDCPRDAFLGLIRKMNPRMFCSFECNGSFNSPFFVTRFKETLFYFSAFFDILDCTLQQDNPQRLMIEEEYLGRTAINVIACEGYLRATRPETYKQWQVRITRAGFKELPLDQHLMHMCRRKCKKYYHKDVIFDQDGPWLLQGWKGRLLSCTSCWVPA